MYFVVGSDWDRSGEVVFSADIVKDIDKTIEEQWRNPEARIYTNYDVYVVDVTTKIISPVKRAHINALGELVWVQVTTPVAVPHIGVVSDPLEG